MLAAQCSRTYRRLLSSAVGSKFINMNTIIRFTRLLSQLYSGLALEKSLKYLYIVISDFINLQNLSKIKLETIMVAERNYVSIRKFTT